jgi:positive regulator of sigma E activity
VAVRRLRRGGRVVHDDHGPVLHIGAECTAAGCSGAGACGRPVAERSIPLRWIPVDGRDPGVGDWVEISVQAVGLTRVAAICFGLPLLVLIGASWLVGVAAMRAGFAGDTLPAVVGLLSAGAMLMLVSRHGPQLVQQLQLRVNTPEKRNVLS